MKVICVDTVKGSFTSSGKKTDMPPVYVGNEYNVVDKKSRSFKGKTWVLYELDEIKPNPHVFLYCSDLFAECSTGIDETELVNEKVEVYGQAR